uniref:Uncharacterized protein n=1 Tax=Trichuris muris TaxID=70415 RepID=A0A5S6Q0Y2_TRIMR
MDALYLETNSVIQQVHQRVAQLENVNDQAAAATLESAIVQQLETVASNCDKLDLMCENQPVNRKKYAKQLVEQLRYDCDHVKVALSVIQNRLLMDWKKKNEREELLSRRFTPNEATCIYLDDAAAVHNSKLRSVHKNVDSMIDTGRSVLVFRESTQPGVFTEGNSDQSVRYWEPLGTFRNSNAIHRASFR